MFQLDASESFDAWRKTVQYSFSSSNEFPAYCCWCVFPHLKVTCSLKYQLSEGEKTKIFCVCLCIWKHIYCQYSEQKV